MSTMDLWLSGGNAGDEMAKAKARTVDVGKVAAIVEQLRQAVGDADAFKDLCSAISDDTGISTAEVAEIANGFAGGEKPKTRKSALSAIMKERLRVAHAKHKGNNASKARHW